MRRLRCGREQDEQDKNQRQDPVGYTPALSETAQRGHFARTCSCGLARRIHFYRNNPIRVRETQISREIGSCERVSSRAANVI